MPELIEKDWVHPDQIKVDVVGVSGGLELVKTGPVLDQSAVWPQYDQEISSNTYPWFSQCFLCQISGLLAKIHLYLGYIGSPGNLLVQIRTDDGTGKPSSTVLTSESFSPSFSPNPKIIALTFSNPVSLSSGTYYHICCNYSGNGSNHWLWRYLVPFGYEYGEKGRSSDGSSWTLIYLAGSYFRTYMTYYPSTGELVSQIFYLTRHLTAYGTLLAEMTLGAYGSISFKARTSNDPNMSGATAWASCDSINSGEDISSKVDVTDGERYIQFQAILSTSDVGYSPILHKVTINYEVDVLPLLKAMRHFKWFSSGVEKPFYWAG